MGQKLSTMNRGREKDVPTQPLCISLRTAAAASTGCMVGSTHGVERSTFDVGEITIGSIKLTFGALGPCTSPSSSRTGLERVGRMSENMTNSDQVSRYMMKRRSVKQKMSQGISMGER